MRGKLRKPGQGRGLRCTSFVIVPARLFFPFDGNSYANARLVVY